MTPDQYAAVALIAAAVAALAWRGWTEWRDTQALLNLRAQRIHALLVRNQDQARLIEKLMAQTAFDEHWRQVRAVIADDVAGEAEAWLRGQS